MVLKFKSFYFMPMGGLFLIYGKKERGNETTTDQ